MSVSHEAAVWTIPGRSKYCSIQRPTGARRGWASKARRHSPDSTMVLHGFRGPGGFADDPVCHERRRHDHDDRDREDGDRGGQVGVLHIRLDPAMERREQDRQRQRPGERRKEWRGQQVAEIDPGGGHGHQHERTHMEG